MATGLENGTMRPWSEGFPHQAASAWTSASAQPAIVLIP
jgi:hypothetical protein